MPGRPFLLLLLAAMLGGCATRRDVRDLQAEIQAMRSAQQVTLQEIRAEIRRQNALVLDTLVVQDVRMRGDFANRLVQIERQLIAIQELTGQGQQRLADLREQLRAQEETLRAAATANAGGVGASGNANELFETSQGALTRGSYATARAGFEELLQTFPQHELVPAALLGIGESWEKAGDRTQALAAYQRVVELHPNSTQAPTALYRAALIEVAQNNRARARTMLDQLINMYPRSPEVTQARTQRARL